MITKTQAYVQLFIFCICHSLLGVGYLDNVRLDSARQGGSGQPVNTIEYCQCPEGYVGQFCESCAPGFHREVTTDGSFTKCVPCNCNGHSEDCDVNTGKDNNCHVF